MPHTKTQRSGRWYGMDLDALGLERVTWYGGRSWDLADGSASGAPHVTCYEVRRRGGDVLAVAERRHGEPADAAARRCADAARGALRAESDAAVEVAVLGLSRALDPMRTADCWPNPVTWDGRPIRVQARDLLVLADAEAERIDADPEIVDAAKALRASLLADFGLADKAPEPDADPEPCALDCDCSECASLEIGYDDERDRLERILSDLAARRPLRCFLPICGAALRCHRNLGHAGECSGASDPDPGRREIHPRRCSGCGRYERRVRLRVAFTTDGRARVVCDGCLEPIQRDAEAWAFCYLPAWWNR